LGDAGTIVSGGSAVRGVLAGQPAPFYSPDNPMLLWSATFTTDDFRPRDIEVRAVVDGEFYVYPHGGASPVSRLGDYTQSVGVIRVRQTADCDGSGAVDFGDFLCFQERFAAGDPQADFDVDGEIT